MPKYTLDLNPQPSTPLFFPDIGKFVGNSIGNSIDFIKILLQASLTALSIINRVFSNVNFHRPTSI